jgi:hypothetical protein
MYCRFKASRVAASEDPSEYDYSPGGSHVLDILRRLASSSWCLVIAVSSSSLGCLNAQGSS